MFSFYGLSLFKIGSLENIFHNIVNTVAFMRGNYWSTKME